MIVAVSITGATLGLASVTGVLALIALAQLISFNRSEARRTQPVAIVHRHGSVDPMRIPIHVTNEGAGTAVLRAEVIEGRDLNEHWAENMPIFNVSPRPETPSRRSGKDFAERNPRRGPYSQSNWNLKTGAMLLPNVSASALHDLLDDAEAEVLESTPSLSEYIPERAPSPWVYENGEWWPKPEDG